jgi:RNA-directed DNA polymerase
MTEDQTSGALSSKIINWKAINWPKVEKHTKRLQERIVKAAREHKHNKVKVLQRILTRSFCARLIAVKRVTSRKGSKTPGVDRKTLNTPRKKVLAAQNLRLCGYKVLPLRRIYILKKNGKKRPLGIPTIADRVVQALFLLALQPISEVTADPNSYGFRPYRACRDAIMQCFNALAKKYSAVWILEADIKACFDWIDHDWLLANVCIEKKILKKWLKSGFIENNTFNHTLTGTPQGGIISPTLANITLDGLEQVVKNACPNRSLVNFVRYADDFIVTARSKDLLVHNIIPAINDFLKPRGLQLSQEKTRITRIEDGFDFLGQNLRKYNGKLITKPSKDSVKNLIEKIRLIIKRAKGWSAENLIHKLNPVLRGWANYHRFIQSSKTYSYIDSFLYRSLLKWAKHEHPNKRGGWISRKYFLGSTSHLKWMFHANTKKENGANKTIFLVRLACNGLGRYIKIRANSNPFDKTQREYFKLRRICKNYTEINTNLWLRNVLLSLK